MNELAVLQALRLKGRASVSELAEATDLALEVVCEQTDALLASGGARELGAALLLLPGARPRLDQLLSAERAGIDPASLAPHYDQFSAVNKDFKGLAAGWQLRDGAPNDHGDPAYDQSILDQLPSIDRRVGPIVAAVAEIAPRLAPFARRFAAALAKVEAGEHQWFLKPLIDSYHTVWFEFHEELIAISGRNRLDEAAAGHAD